MYVFKRISVSVHGVLSRLTIFQASQVTYSMLLCLETNYQMVSVFMFESRVFSLPNNLKCIKFSSYYFFSLQGHRSLCERNSFSIQSKFSIVFHIISQSNSASFAAVCSFSLITSFCEPAAHTTTVFRLSPSPRLGFQTVDQR